MKTAVLALWVAGLVMVVLAIVGAVYLVAPYTPAEFQRRCRPAVLDARWRPPFDWPYLGNPLADQVRATRARGRTLLIGSEAGSGMEHALCSSPARTRLLAAASSLAGIGAYLALGALGVGGTPALLAGMAVVLALRFASIAWGVRLPTFRVPDGEA